MPRSTGHDLVRVGPKGDGGYILPDDFDEIKAVYSAGVGFESGFELEFARMGIPCFLADASVSGPAISHPMFAFKREFLTPEPGGGLFLSD